MQLNVMTRVCVVKICNRDDVVGHMRACLVVCETATTVPAPPNLVLWVPWSCFHAPAARLHSVARAWAMGPSGGRTAPGVTGCGCGSGVRSCQG